MVLSTHFKNGVMPLFINLFFSILSEKLAKLPKKMEFIDF